MVPAKMCSMCVCAQFWHAAGKLCGARSAATASVLLARRRAQSARDREDIHGPHVAILEGRPCTGVAAVAGQVCHGGSVQPCTTDAQAQAPQVLHSTQFLCPAERGHSPPAAQHALQSARTPAPGWASPPGQCANSQALDRLTQPPAWNQQLQDAAATQLCCSPQKQACAGAVADTPTSALQQVHCEGMQSQPPARQTASDMPPKDLRLATLQPRCGVQATSTSPQRVQPAPAPPQSPPGSYGARMAERFRQAETLLRAHGGAGTAELPEPGNSSAGGAVFAEESRPETLARWQHGGARTTCMGYDVDRITVSGHGGGGEYTMQRDGRPAAAATWYRNEAAAHTAAHRGGDASASGARACLLSTAPSGAPLRKRARTKAQRLQLLQQRQEELLVLNAQQADTNMHANQFDDDAVSPVGGLRHPAAEENTVQGQEAAHRELVDACTNCNRVLLEQLVPEDELRALLDSDENDDAQFVIMESSSCSTP